MVDRKRIPLLCMNFNRSSSSDAIVLLIRDSLGPYSTGHLRCYGFARHQLISGVVSCNCGASGVSEGDEESMCACATRADVIRFEIHQRSVADAVFLTGRSSSAERFWVQTSMKFALFLKPLAHVSYVCNNLLRSLKDLAANECNERVKSSALWLIACLR
jgi:hypothetical protein